MMITDETDQVRDDVNRTKKFTFDKAMFTLTHKRPDKVVLVNLFKYLKLPVKLEFLSIQFCKSVFMVRELHLFFANWTNKEKGKKRKSKMYTFCIHVHLHENLY